MEGSPNLGAVLFKRTLPLAALVAVAIAHGMIFSPLYDFVSYFVSVFSRRTVFYSPMVLEQLPSVLIALFTVMLAGIPAAIYERVRGHGDSTPVSIAIWLVATLLISAPVILRALGLR
jgi:hypothetical protein